jgi:hypothetical protein
VCRAGNLQLIPQEVNLRRGDKPITDKWVEENGLRYQHYPSGAEYATIVIDKVLVSADAFNAMCQRRELLLKQHIVRLVCGDT